MRNIFIVTFIILTSCTNQQKENQITEDINNFVDQFDLGKKLMKEKKYNEAIIIFTNQIRIHPSTAALYEYRAMSYGQTNKHDSAIIDMNTVIQINPQNISSLFLRGQLKYDGSYYKDAITDFDSVILRKPDFNEAYLYKGITLLKINKTQDACDCFSTALKYGNDDAQTYIDKHCESD